MPPHEEPQQNNDDNNNNATVTTQQSCQKKNNHSDNESNNNKNKKHIHNNNNNYRTVSFDVVEIREYPIILGNNPSSTYGPPIEIGWDYIELESCDIEDHVNRKPIKRNIRALYVTPIARENIILRSRKTVTTTNGEQKQHYYYTKQDIQQAIHEKNRIRNQRQQTNVFRNLNPINDVRKEIRYRKRRRKILCALKNLQKQKEHHHRSKQKQPTTAPTKPKGVPVGQRTNIYKGWWLPGSAYIF